MALADVGWHADGHEAIAGRRYVEGVAGWAAAELADRPVRDDVTEANPVTDWLNVAATAITPFVGSPVPHVSVSVGPPGAACATPGTSESMSATVAARTISFDRRLIPGAGVVIDFVPPNSLRPARTAARPGDGSDSLRVRPVWTHGITCPLHGVTRFDADGCGSVPDASSVPELPQRTIQRYEPESPLAYPSVAGVVRRTR